MCHLQDLYVQYKDKGLVILGLNASDEKQIAIEFLGENRATFPMILDASGAGQKVVFQDYQRSGSSAVPLSYIIDGQGKVVDAWYGYEEGHPKAMAALQKAGGKLGEAVRWELEDKVARSAAEVAAAAKRLFEAIRTADYDHDWITTGDWERFPAKDAEYTVERGYPSWVRWVCAKFKADPIAEVRLGKVFAGPTGRPTVHFELHLKDGEILQGDLPFQWDSEKKQWVGWEGLDWHLRKTP
jgi:hypothetical protein